MIKYKKRKYLFRWKKLSDVIYDKDNYIWLDDLKEFLDNGYKENK